MLLSSRGEGAGVTIPLRNTKVDVSHIMANNGQASQGYPLDRTEDGKPRFLGCSRIQNYEWLCKLGEGTFGQVSKARSKKTGQIVALKKILMHNEKDGFPITALREIKLLKQLDHVNVLKLEEMAVERSKNPTKKASMFMVTPYMDHDLSGLLQNPSVVFTEPQIKCYMKQLFEGCAYLHENRILHRDMKAANLLINNKGLLQIADFGLARPYDDEPPKPGKGGGIATREYTTLVVTRWYRPPELLLQLRKYTTAIDMWGVGCVFGEMFKRKPILAGDTDLNQALMIFDLVGSPTEETMPGWRDLPGCENVRDFAPSSSKLQRVFKDQGALAISLLTELLKLDWRKRINAIDALQHPYFHTAPYPARPGDIPKFEESHELDRRKFRDQQNKPPPAPAGGDVGVGAQGEWGVDGRPVPYNHRGPNRGPGGGRQYANGNGRRMPQHDRGGDRDYRQPRPYDNSYDRNRGPPPSYDDGYARRPLPPQDMSLPPRPPPPEIDAYNGPHRADHPPYRERDDGRGPPPRPRLPPVNDAAGPPGGRRQPEKDRAPPAVDTYIPSYSSADPNARPPPTVLRSNRRPVRDDRPPSKGDPYGEDILRYDDDAYGGVPPPRARTGSREGPPGPAGPYERRRSRSPIRRSPHPHEYRERDRGHPQQEYYRR